MPPWNEIKMFQISMLATYIKCCCQTRRAAQFSRMRHVCEQVRARRDAAARKRDHLSVGGARLKIEHSDYIQHARADVN